MCQPVSKIFYYRVGRYKITKHLMTGPTGNSEVCFPSNTEGLGEAKLSLVTLRPLSLSVVDQERMKSKRVIRELSRPYY